jgi:hypothetical protein
MKKKIEYKTCEICYEKKEKKNCHYTTLVDFNYEIDFQGMACGDCILERIEYIVDYGRADNESFDRADNESFDREFGAVKKEFE